MSEPTFQFDGYTLRKIRERDRELLSAWIDADFYHNGRVLPDFFLRCLPGEDAWALEDEHGFVVFYMKTQTATRLHMQFGPSKTDEETLRNRTALKKGMAWLEGILAANKFREILFQTDNPMLALFTCHQLGFERSHGEMTHIITPPNVMK